MKVKTVSPIFIAISVWLGLALFYIGHTWDGAYTHDYRGHLEYTTIIQNQGRLPAPWEGWETYHPPVYYLINSAVGRHNPRHAHYIRLFSVFYGVLSLWCVSLLLKDLKIDSTSQCLSTILIATTPAFVHIFTGYNNDSLSTLFSVAILLCAWFWLGREKIWARNVLCPLMALGLYTKYDVGFTMGTLVIVVSVLRGKNKLPTVKWVQLCGLVIVSALCLTPWLVFHNRRYTGKLLPYNSEHGLNAELKLPKSALRTVLTPPGFSDGEWTTPYTLLWANPFSKKTSFWSFLFSTSIFGEYDYKMPFESLPWSIVWLNLLILFSGFRVIGHNRHTKVSSLLVLAAVPWVVLFTFYLPYAPAMDFRFISWVWVPLSVIYAYALQLSPHVLSGFPLPRLGVVFALCALFQIYFVSLIR